MKLSLNRNLKNLNDYTFDELMIDNKNKNKPSIKQIDFDYTRTKNQLLMQEIESKSQDIADFRQILGQLRPDAERIELTQQLFELKHIKQKILETEERVKKYQNEYRIVQNETEKAHNYLKKLIDLRNNSSKDTNLSINEYLMKCVELKNLQREIQVTVQLICNQ